MYMVKIQMKIGAHRPRRSLHIQPKNQMMFGLNGRGKQIQSTTTTESCGSCLPPPSNSFDSILEHQLMKLEESKARQQFERKSYDNHMGEQVMHNTNRQQYERELYEKIQHNMEEREKRVKEQREREQREREQREQRERE